MKRLRTEDYMRALEFEAAFKEFKILSFNEALENVKKSSQNLINETLLRVAEKEARALAECCFELAEKIMLKEDCRVKYFGSGYLEEGKSLCKVIDEGEEEIKEFEGFYEKVAEAFEELVGNVSKVRECDGEIVKYEKEFRVLAENIKGMQGRIKDLKENVELLVDRYREERKDFEENKKKLNQLGRSLMLEERIPTCFKGGDYKSDLKQRIEKFSELKEQNIAESLNLTQNLEESENLLKGISMEIAEVSKDSEELHQIASEFKEKYTELEKELNIKSKNKKASLRDVKKSNYKWTVIKRELENTKMQIEEITHTKKLLTTTLKLADQILDSNTKFQVLHT